MKKELKEKEKKRENEKEKEKEKEAPVTESLDFAAQFNRLKKKRNQMQNLINNEKTIGNGIEDYNVWEVFELKSELKDRGLEYKGRKDALIERLITNDIDGVPMGREDQIVYGENVAEIVEALLDGRREREED